MFFTNFLYAASNYTTRQQPTYIYLSYYFYYPERICYSAGMQVSAVFVFPPRYLPFPRMQPWIVVWKVVVDFEHTIHALYKCCSCNYQSLPFIHILIWNFRHNTITISVFPTPQEAIIFSNIFYLRSKKENGTPIDLEKTCTLNGKCKAPAVSREAQLSRPA